LNNLDLEEFFKQEYDQEETKTKYYDLEQSILTTGKAKKVERIDSYFSTMEKQKLFDSNLPKSEEKVSNFIYAL
jgi:hypothetical protein